MIHRIISIAAATIGIGSLAVIAFGVSVIGFDRPYLSYTNSPFPVTVKEAKIGDTVPVLAGRCNADSKTRHYTTSHGLRNLQTGRHYILPDMFVSIAPGCTVAESLINYVPPGVVPGEYIFYGTAVINGSLRSADVDWESKPFKVVQ